MHRLRTSLRTFAKDEGGALLAEALILMPLMIWGFLALIVYWDVFRTINMSQKAAYSIADLLSRQEVVTPVFVSGLANVLTFLTPGSPESRMRITSIEYDETADEYTLLWSRSPGGKVDQHTFASVQLLETKIPEMADLDSVIIVETWVDYTPAFDIGVLNMAPGLTDQTFTQFIVTDARRRRVCLDGTDTCA